MLLGLLPLAVLAASPTWPLTNVKTLIAEGVLTSGMAAPQQLQQWFQFAAGPPHCDLRQRIQYLPASGNIVIVDPANNDTIYKVLYSNSKCTTAGPSPMVQDQCINPFSALGAGYTFTGSVPCPPPSTASACELWTLTSTATVQTYVFESNTNIVVQYTIQPTASGSVRSVLSYSQFMVDVPVPSSAWQTPKDWEPCTPNPPGAVVDAPAEPGR